MRLTKSAIGLAVLTGAEYNCLASMLCTNWALESSQYNGRGHGLQAKANGINIKLTANVRPSLTLTSAERY